MLERRPIYGQTHTAPVCNKCGASADLQHIAMCGRGTAGARCHGNKIKSEPGAGIVDEQQSNDNLKGGSISTRPR